MAARQHVFAVVRHQTVVAVVGLFESEEEAAATAAHLTEAEAEGGAGGVYTVVPAASHRGGRTGVHVVVGEPAREPAPSMEDLLDKARAAGMDPTAVVPIDQMTARVALNILDGLDRFLRDGRPSHDHLRLLTLGQVDDEPAAPSMLHAALDGVQHSLRRALGEER